MQIALLNLINFFRWSLVSELLFIYACKCVLLTLTKFGAWLHNCMMGLLNVIWVKELHEMFSLGYQGYYACCCHHLKVFLCKLSLRNITQSILMVWFKVPREVGCQCFHGERGNIRLLMTHQLFLILGTEMVPCMTIPYYYWLLYQF